LVNSRPTESTGETRLCLNKNWNSAYYTPPLGLCTGMPSTRGQNGIYIALGLLSLSTERRRRIEVKFTAFCQAWWNTFIGDSRSVRRRPKEVVYVGRRLTTGSVRPPRRTMCNSSQYSVQTASLGVARTGSAWA